MNCGHDTGAFGAIHGTDPTGRSFAPFDALGLAAAAAALFGTCSDHADAEANISFEKDAKGVRGTATLTTPEPRKDVPMTEAYDLHAEGQEAALSDLRTADFLSDLADLLDPLGDFGGGVRPDADPDRWEETVDELSDWPVAMVDEIRGASMVVRLPDQSRFLVTVQQLAPEQGGCEPTGRTLSDGRDVLSCGAPANPAGYCCEHGAYVGPQPQGTRCAAHPAYDADYCPRCGTATVIPDDAR